MHVVQVIDSLHIGGAERMAVNLANAFAKTEDISSSLCVTRAEGGLKASLDDTVDYLFLGRKQTFDIGAIKRFRDFANTTDVSVVHAHGTSYFFIFMAKLFGLKAKLVWHVHNGALVNVQGFKKFILKIAIKKFDGIVTVNEALREWAAATFQKKTSYIQNFVTINSTAKETVLKGETGKRIVCLANLRPVKDHHTLIDAFAMALKSDPTWSLHLVGEAQYDDYVASVQAHISEKGLQDAVYNYGSRNDVDTILAQATVGVLSSTSEGLPLALLEYGKHSLAAIVTDVGQCGKVVRDGVDGLVVSPKDINSYADALKRMMTDADFVSRCAYNFKQRIDQEYSAERVVQQLITYYKTL